MRKPDIPTGIEHLRLVEDASTLALRLTAEIAHAQQSDCELIGSSLNALYQAATCHRECHGGPHILEALCGRLYNLGSSAYILATRGYYDESLNLVRSMGEISNLVSMSVVDKAALQKWLASDKNTRKRDFSAVRIRVLLEEKAPELLIADEDWYSRFCEAYTHVTPHTKPNQHSETEQSHVGGVFQSQGYTKTIGELATVLASVAMLVCRYFKLEDLFAEINRLIHAIPHSRGATGEAS